MKEGHGSPGGQIHSMQRDGDPQEGAWTKPRARPSGETVTPRREPGPSPGPAPWEVRIEEECSQQAVFP